MSGKQEDDGILCGTARSIFNKILEEPKKLHAEFIHVDTIRKIAKEDFGVDVD